MPCSTLWAPELVKGSASLNFLVTRLVEGSALLDCLVNRLVEWSALLDYLVTRLVEGSALLDCLVNRLVKCLGELLLGHQVGKGECLGIFTGSQTYWPPGTG